MTMTEMYWNNLVWHRTVCVGNTDLKLHNSGKLSGLNWQMSFTVICVGSCNFALGIAYL